MQEVFIDTEYVTLSQFLKMTDFIQSGGHAKFFLMDYDVVVNGLKEDRRGKKLYPEDQIQVESTSFVIKKSNA